MSLASDARIAEALGWLPGWERRANALEKSFDRKNFDGSIAFVKTVAAAAKRLDHHPDITISWNEVRFTLSSHDAGGITERDFALALAIEKLAAEREE